MSLFVGRVDEVREDGGERRGLVSVRGARLEVALDLVPEAGAGDSVLVHARVALSRIRDEEEEPPCA